LHKNTASEDHQNKIYDALAGSIDNIDLIVFSDFNYGCLSNSLINRITRLAKQNGVFITADSQSSSQVGDVCRFKEMDLITPTEHEARLCTRKHEDGLVVLSDEVQKKSLAKNILLKLGEEGMLIQPHNDGKTNDWKTDRIGAINKSPRDVSGAGDSLLIVSSMALALGANIWESACLGAFAASVQVGRVGNVPMKIDEILAELA